MNHRTETLLLVVLFASACSAQPPAEPAGPAGAGTDAPPAASVADPGQAPRAATSTGADGDVITALCFDMIPTYGRERCACGTKSFIASNKDAGTYAVMATHYLESTNPELPAEERWNQTVDAVLTGTPEARQEAAHEFSKAHLEAIEGCRD